MEFKRKLRMKDSPSPSPPSNDFPDLRLCSSSLVSCAHPSSTPPPTSSFTSTPGLQAACPPVHHQCRIRGRHL
ncbi:hypothetical protein CHARACLAT_021622 [Characodon lateralis]|uniref:Uncharacterized protein n=1 Tax=Characodon lateralis TaxID=208331 RepID=A0ABU7F5M3_9TELE|nr:hypothetical protein [Characodon lateralis]